MTSENQTCPYPGLRPFTEEESIFFKGRDEHIKQIVRQLEEKKFLMLTGASGDGKSSLVYAGVVPHARAGFFKAKFNNWIVADFRPERTPLSNMARSLTTRLKLDDPLRVEKEFGFGFSSLIETYKQTPFWVDQNSPEFVSLSPDEQKKAKRKGANLLILVDQFEEFFTNPENYLHGKSSIESQAVVNLLLETTRLAIEQDVPIYIICTMRSDYIGQCAAFRGLPEYIGYSQFFVPRLKRKEIYQVIEEPAILNGNRISKRLIEMLINEMSDGIDQLPVLQHALNQVWHKANKGRDEMDVIHFAMINGIPREQLSAEDQLVYDKWFDQLPEFKRSLFAKSSLGDVLDAHANELYENANKGLEDEISLKDAKLIVKTTFKCLTKIDENRAVRNRMTIGEITRIINRPHITIDIVNHVLLPFREQGTTFLRPFVNDEHSNEKLPDSIVLDITHESLIRNWDKLSYWANQEYEHLQLWRDFEKQLNRWLQNGKSSGYLLPIGPLTFFENWYNKVRINKFWLARYDEREVAAMQKLADGERTLQSTNQFIKRSSRRLFVSKTIIKYGADRLIGVFALLLFLFSCTYFYFNFRGKQNDQVLQDTRTDGISLLASQYIHPSVKGNFILVHERLYPGSYQELLSPLVDSVRFEVVKDMLRDCLLANHNRSPGEPENSLIEPLLNIQLHYYDSILANENEFDGNFDKILSTVASVIAVRKSAIGLRDSASVRFVQLGIFEGFLNLLDDTVRLKKIDADRFVKLLQVLPAFMEYNPLKIRQLVEQLSPFNSETLPIFNSVFPVNKNAAGGSGSITHNGGYYHLTNMYSLLGDVVMAKRCFDSLVTHNKNFVNGEWGYSYNTIVANMMLSGCIFSKEGREFLDAITTLKKGSGNREFDLELSVLSDQVSLREATLVDYMRDIAKMDFQPFNFELGISLMTPRSVNELLTKLLAQNAVRAIQVESGQTKDTGNRRHYVAALINKIGAFANSRYDNYDTLLARQYLTAAFKEFSAVDHTYGEEDVKIGAGSEVKQYSRAQIFLFPSLVWLRNGRAPLDDYYLSKFRNKSVFFDYVSERFSIGELYLQSNVSADMLNQYLLNYFHAYFQSYYAGNFIHTAQLEHIALKKSSGKLDNDVILGALAADAYNTGKIDKAYSLSDAVDVKALLEKERVHHDFDSYRYYTVAGLVANVFFLRAAADLNSKYYMKGVGLIRVFPDPYAKRNAMLASIDTLQRRRNDLFVTALLDSFICGFAAKSARYGNILFQELGRMNTSYSQELVMMLVKDKNDQQKVNCFRFLVRGLAESGQFYQAVQTIPEYFSNSTRLAFYTNILHQQVINRGSMRDGWSFMDIRRPGPWQNAYENNQAGISIVEEQ